MAAAWPQAKVVDTALRVSIHEIREALGDEANEPKFIETVGKKGYRFVAPVGLKLPEAGKQSFVPFIGRSAELDMLRHHLEIANSGKRQVVFISGEAGIGKTTLVEACTKSLPTSGEIITAHGQCIEQYGSGKAYFPIYDALERICNGPNGPQACQLLRRYAPSWLVNFPDIDPTERDVLNQQIIGITPERRLREIAGFFEAISKDRTLLLILEDLHWVDPSTLALICFLARRPEQARLMLIGTYREGEVESANHSLKHVKQELELHHHCSHLSLKLLSRSAVGEYLAARFETPLISNNVLSTVYQRSEGNPLFMVNVTDYLLAREAITQQHGSVELAQQIEKETPPTTLCQLIEREFETLHSDNQQLLEVASVRGMSFSAAILAAALGKSIEKIEKQCSRLVKHQQFLQSSGAGKWPDGTVSSWYSFIHVLYQNVIYDRIGDSRKARLHQTIGEWLEAGYKDATDDIAATLAAQFERGGDHARAARYFLRAAEWAMRQSGYPEAIAHARSGLKLISSLRNMPNLLATELQLRLSASLSLTALNGYASSEATDSFQETRELCQRAGKQAALIQVLSGLWIFHLMRAEFESALELANEILRIAYALEEPLLIAHGHMAAGRTQFYLGNFAAAKKHCDKSLNAYEPNAPHSRVLVYGWDTRVGSLTYGAGSLWMLGYPTKSLDFNQRGSLVAQEVSNPLNSVIANGMLAGNHQFRREADKSLGYAETALKAATGCGFSNWIASASITSGWSLAATGKFQEGIARLNYGLKLWKTTGARAELPRFTALLAEAYLLAGQVRDGLQSVADAMGFMEQTNERYYEAELHRLKGELCRNRSRQPIPLREAENCFVKAIDVARRQKAKSLELRATMSLCRLWQQQGKNKEARQLLKKVYGWFTEGFDTPDLKEAKKLLHQLSLMLLAVEMQLLPNLFEWQLSLSEVWENFF